MSLSSKVPKYTFLNTLAEQEAQLKTNPLLLRFKKSRAQLTRDPHLPIYHFVSPENLLNDPNGLTFWQGRWHLFYQGYPPEDPRQHWGHAVSEDLIHWRDLPYAIYPNPEHACFSGSVLVEDNRVIAMYHGTRVGNMVAVSSDPLLLNWEKLTGQAVITTNKLDSAKLPYSIGDPCIWKKDSLYYSLSGGTLPGGPDGKIIRANFLFRSKDLEKWEYLHPFVENDKYSIVGDDGSCPYFWPIGDKHILLYYSHMSGGKYFLGDYDLNRDKFIVTAGGNFNFGASDPAGVHAPSAVPDGKGGIIAIFNMNPGKPTTGWNQIMSLPRRLTLLGKEDIDNLGIEPAENIESLRHSRKSKNRLAIPANQEVILDEINGNAMEIIAKIDIKNAQVIEFNIFRSPDGVEVTRILFYKNKGYYHHEFGWDSELHRKRSSMITIDSSHSSVLPDVQPRPPESAPVFIEENETLNLRVLIDKSVVEVFVNGRQCVAQRVYPGLKDSTGVSLRSQGSNSELISLNAWQMNSISE